MEKKEENKKKKLALGYRIMIYIVICYLMLCAFLYFMQETMIFPTYAVYDVSHYTPPESAQQVWIDTEEGKVEGWYFAPKENKSPAPTVVFFHGNAEAIDFAHQDLRQYLHWGFAIFLPEYRGYGRSKGTPNQKKISSDMRKFREWLVKQPGVDKNRIVYHARSLGGGIACQLATTHPPVALILQSTFRSIKAMSAKYLVPSFLVKNPFANDRVVANLSCPIFITHGTQDEIIPVSHGQTLHKLAKGSVYYEVSCGHNDYPMDKNFWEKIQKFFKENKIVD